MAISLSIGITLLVFTGICIQFGVTRRYRFSRRHSEEATFERFEKDVEWQLQHELSNAIEASRDENRDSSPPLLATNDELPHITFVDSQPALGSRQDFKAYSKAELDRLSSPTVPLQQVNGFFDPAEEEHRLHETPLYVNPKQFHRILKRRMARQIIEEYFRSRPQPERHLKYHGERLRRHAGPSGRFLTLDEVASLSNQPNGAVIA